MVDCESVSVIGVPWHIGHQAALCRIFAQYFFVPNMYRRWVTSSRPFPSNAINVESVAEAEQYRSNQLEQVRHYNPRFKDAPTIAILHVDQDAVTDRRKRIIYDGLKQTTSHLPQLVINHGVPINDRLSQDECVEKMRELVGAIPMVVNSHQAREMWGFGTAIIHGYDSEEFNPRPYHEREAKVITYVSKAGMSEMYKREFMVEVRSIVRAKGRSFDWIGVDSDVTNFEDYKERLSRSAIYLHAYPNSPMPRSRTEAMMSGCMIATCKGHGGEDIVEDNVSGVVFDCEVDSAAAVAFRLIELLDNYDRASKLAHLGYKRALKMFSMARYRQDWNKMVESIL